MPLDQAFGYLQELRPEGHHLAHHGRHAQRVGARYLSTSDSKGKVMLTGLGTPNQMREFVEDGTVEAFALWNPGDLGYLAAWAAKAVADGDITGAEGDTFTAGELGDYTVGPDSVVLLGDPFVFNADNIGDFDF